MVYICVDMYVCTDPEHPLTTGYRPGLEELKEAQSYTDDNIMVKLHWSARRGAIGWKTCFVTKDTDIEALAAALKEAAQSAAVSKNFGSTI